LRRPAADTTLSLPELVSNWHLGPMTVASPADLLGHPHVGARVRVAGRLKYDEPEGNRLNNARRFYTLYRIETHEEGDRMWRVSLDLDGTGGDERRVVETFCGGAVACAVTVHGRIGEVVAERTVNLFSPKREFTAMIGVVVEGIDFDGAER
jgi:hypothetical protein